MSVSEETLLMIRAAVKKNANPPGTLIRSKLTNQLLWKSSENDENDPVRDILTIMDAVNRQEQAATRKGRKPLGEISTNCLRMNGDNAYGEMVPNKISMKQHNIENWQDQWEILKNAGQYCSFCKNNKEGGEIYLSHNLKGPDGEVACPILRECICNCCGGRGHTIAHCPENRTGTSILKMINRQNRI